MPTFDCKCEKCENIWEVVKKYHDPAQDCPKCGSSFTRTILSRLITPTTSDPYDALDKFRDYSTKPIKSFANDKRKGGKNTV